MKKIKFYFLTSLCLCFIACDTNTFEPLAMTKIVGQYEVYSLRTASSLMTMPLVQGATTKRIIFEIKQEESSNTFVTIGVYHKEETGTKSSYSGGSKLSYSIEEKNSRISISQLGKEIGYHEGNILTINYNDKVYGNVTAYAKAGQLLL